MMNRKTGAKGDWEYKQRTASLYHFMNHLIDSLLAEAEFIHNAYFVYESGPRGPSVDYDELEQKVQFSSKFKFVVAIHSAKDIFYSMPIQVLWEGYILSEKYPERPKAPETDLYKFITTYSVALVHGSTFSGVVVFDAKDHHAEIFTHPHHMHEIRNNKNRDPLPYSGLIKDMVSEIIKRI